MDSMARIQLQNNNEEKKLPPAFRYLLIWKSVEPLLFMVLAFVEKQ
jgi:hypothetical protein